MDTIEPINDTIRNKYNSLSDRGRFITGACVGFTASRVIVGSKFYDVICISYVLIEINSLLISHL